MLGEDAFPLAAGAGSLRRARAGSDHHCIERFEVGQLRRVLDLMCPHSARMQSGGQRRGHPGVLGDDRARLRRGGRKILGGRPVERRPEARVAATAADLTGLGARQDDTGRGLNDVGLRRHVVAAHDLDEAGFVDHGHF